MKNAFSHEKYKDALGKNICFKPIFEYLKAKDYDALAKRYAQNYSFHCVVEDSECSKAWTDALKKYATKDGTVALVAALYSDSGLQIKKMRTRLQADMDRGLIKQSRTQAVILFNFNNLLSIGEHYIFDFNRNLYDF